MGASLEHVLMDDISEACCEAAPREKAAVAGERRQRIVAVTAGVGLGVVTSVVLGLVAPSSSAVGRMFRPTSIESLIPAAILSFFFWGVLLCVFRGRRLRGLERQNPTGALAAIADRLRRGEGAAVCTELDRGASSPLRRRLLAVLKQWQASPSLQDVDLMLQQQRGHDEEEMHRAYGLVRLLVWALPVMGLIGTVIGISLAVGGFAEFLAGSVDDVSLIKQNLVNVTGGLSFAFLITLEGLATSLVLMFWVSALQSNESRFAAGIQQQIFDVILPALQVGAPGAAATSAAVAGPVGESIKQELAASTKSVLVTTQRLGQELLRSFAAHLTDQQNKNAEWMQSLAARLPQESIRFSDAILQASATMKETVESFSRETDKLGQQLEAERTQLAATLQAHVRAIGDAHEQAAARVGEQSAALTAGAAAIREAARSASEAARSHEIVLKKVESVNVGSVLEGVEKLTEVITTQIPQLEGIQRAFDALAEGTRRLLSAQETLHATTKQFGEVRVVETLASVRDAMLSVRPALEGFRKPFVLQAVPVAANGCSTEYVGS